MLLPAIDLAPEIDFPSLTEKEEEEFLLTADPATLDPPLNLDDPEDDTLSESLPLLLDPSSSWLLRPETLFGPFFKMDRGLPPPPPPPPPPPTIDPLVAVFALPDTLV